MICPECGLTVADETDHLDDGKNGKPEGVADCLRAQLANLTAENAALRGRAETATEYRWRDGDTRVVIGMNGGAWCVWTDGYEWLDRYGRADDAFAAYRAAQGKETPDRG